MSDDISSVLEFWFGDAPATAPDELRARFQRWYQGGPALDEEIRQKFGPLVEEAVGGGLKSWEASPDGLLALILLLDQFTRSVFRDQPRMYAGDARAQRLAVAALDAGIDAAWDHERKQFLRMPLMHAEDNALQERSVAEVRSVTRSAPPDLQRIYGMGEDQARKYLAVVGRFGRFPHRNAILGRTSTPEEEAFLKDWALLAPPSGLRRE